MAHNRVSTSQSTGTMVSVVLGGEGVIYEPWCKCDWGLIFIKQGHAHHTTPYTVTYYVGVSKSDHYNVAARVSLHKREGEE